MVKGFHCVLLCLVIHRRWFSSTNDLKQQTSLTGVGQIAYLPTRAVTDAVFMASSFCVCHTEVVCPAAGVVQLRLSAVAEFYVRMTPYSFFSVCLMSSDAKRHIGDNM